MSERKRLKLRLDGAELAVEEAYKEYYRSIEAMSDDIAESIIESGEAHVAEAEIDILASKVGMVYDDVGRDESSNIALILGTLALPFAAFGAQAISDKQKLSEDILSSESESILSGANEIIDEVVGANQSSRFAITPGQKRKIKSEIAENSGLSAREIGFVRTYEEALRSNSRKALDRALRERSFDQSVKDRVKSKKPFTEIQIQRMVKAYKKRLIDSKAKRISRTMGTRLVSEAAMRAAENAEAKHGVRMVSTWIPINDNLTRDHHASMSGQTVRIGEVFVDGIGNLIRYPGDPGAPPNTTINCRCQLSFKKLDV